MAFARKI